MLTTKAFSLDRVVANDNIFDINGKEKLSELGVFVKVVNNLDEDSNEGVVKKKARFMAGVGFGTAGVTSRDSDVLSSSQAVTHH